MLNITQPQMDELDAHALEAFFERTFHFLRRIAFEDTRAKSDSDLHNFIKLGYDSARTHGVVTERGIIMWICLNIMAGNTFHKVPEVTRLLADSGDAELALNQLYERLIVIEIRRKV
jgi:hypothetical protein